MSTKETHSLLTITPDANNPNEVIQVGNVAFTKEILSWVNGIWNSNGQTYPPYIGFFPWKHAPGQLDDQGNAYHSTWTRAWTENYPTAGGTNTSMSTQDYRRFKSSGTISNIAQSATPRVFGCVTAEDGRFGNNLTLQNVTLASADIPRDFTQIGTVYKHPPHSSGALVCSTTLNANYVQLTSTNFKFWFWQSGKIDTFRIESGADAGLYHVRHYDWANNRVYLTYFDDSLFVAKATAGSLPYSFGPGRRAYFNETSVIASGAGDVVLSGRYVPGDVRDSFIAKVIYDKSGSATPGPQQGSYYFSMKPFTHGDGATSGTSPDNGIWTDLALISLGNYNTVNSRTFTGGAPGFAFDHNNQRMWFTTYGTADQSGIFYWKWKSLESPREVAHNAVGSILFPELTPSIDLSGPSVAIALDLGSDDKLYVGIYHSSGGTGGVAIINPDLTTQQFGLAHGYPAASTRACVVDKSRFRTSAASDVTTAVGTDQLDTTSTTFTASDIGRVIEISGATADNGQYKIATTPANNQITVTTLAGDPVSFAGGTGGTFKIGDRVYFFFQGDLTTGAGKMNYMESLAPGTFFTRTVAMTNGARATPVVFRGQQQNASIDQTTGCVYWISNDTTVQINKYDPLANTHSAKTTAQLNAPVGGVGSIPTLTTFYTCLANPLHDELWIGSQAGHVKIPLSDFDGTAFKRYHGLAELATYSYANPAGYLRQAGFQNNNNQTASEGAWGYFLAPGGKVYASNSGTGNGQSWATYGRAADNWFSQDQATTQGTSLAINGCFDRVGRFLALFPGGTSFQSQPQLQFYSVEVYYQWDSANSKWIQKEPGVRGATPNKDPSDTISPAVRSKPLHSTPEELIYNVKIAFTNQGGATPPNNEFLGRAGVLGASRTDGATTSGTNNFAGSAFQTTDVGRMLRIESGADAGVYTIVTRPNTNLITISKLNGTAFSASASAGTLSYTIWDVGVSGSNAGPETITSLFADGFSKDNQQDINTISYEFFRMKTALSEFTEPIKFATNIIGPPGSPGILPYWETFPRSSPAQYSPALAAQTALPGAPTTNGDQLFDGLIDKVLNGTSVNANSNKALFWSSPNNSSIWYGALPANSVLGCFASIDFGTDVEVGSIVVRGYTASTAKPYLNVVGSSGMIANLYNNPESTPPANASVIRTSGTTFASVANNNTVSISTGDFLGPISLASNSDGGHVAGTNVFTGTGFLQTHVGMILSITAAGDIGSYRILSVALDGLSVTVRNLDQTTKTFPSTVTSITYEVRDGVREEDAFYVPSMAVPTYKLCVDRLLTPTSAQVRIAPHTTVASQTWECAAATWRHVKRLSYYTHAGPPDVVNNGSWISGDGRERYENKDFKMFMDLTDLPLNMRTGRYWRYSMQPRYTTGIGSSDFWLSSWEFYAPDGSRINFTPYSSLDTMRTDPNFMCATVSRMDFIQASSSAVGGTFNGTANLGGANGDTITLTGGNKFLGFQVRPKQSDGAPQSGTGTFNGTNFATAEVGRFLRVHTGNNAGTIYRIAARPSATQLTVTTPSGNSVSFGSTESNIEYTIHEGIAFGTVNPDFINLGSASTGPEYSILSISDNLQTITISESGQLPITTQQFEIRRKALDNAGTTPNASITARLVRCQDELAAGIYPQQSGDIAPDSRGMLRFWPEDVGTGVQRTDGQTFAATNDFVGSGFSVDDVGRLLLITDGSDKGTYKISGFTSSTQVSIINAYTDAAQNFTASAASLTYKVLGERRFRAAKYVTVLRG